MEFDFGYVFVHLRKPLGNSYGDAQKKIKYQHELLSDVEIGII